MDVTVLVATYGSLSWAELARTRAMPSAAEQARVIHRHGATLAKARNAALALADSEWVIHLDADDELEPGYIDAIAAAEADLRAPAVRYVREGLLEAPWMPRVASHEHDCEAECLRQGNWLVIGTALRTELARRIGWREWPVYEDWDFFQRCWLAGATVEAVPTAIYRAHARPRSRNRAPAMEEKNRVHQEIVAANLAGEVLA